MRRHVTAEDRQIQQEVEESLKVSNHLEAVAQAIQTGQKVQTNVPNYKVPGGGVDPTANLPDEEIDWAELGGVIPGGEKIADLAPVGHTALAAQKSSYSSPKLVISKNQKNAIDKYPSLIDFLGQPEGEKIANQMMKECNKVLAKKIEANSSAKNKYAKICEADRHNMRQYFEGPDWICRVTASGKFVGDEIIYYNNEKDKSFILRQAGTDNPNEFIDVTESFNVIHDFAEKEKKDEENDSVS